MRFIFYRSANDTKAERLESIINEMIQPNIIDIYSSIETLSQGIRFPGGEPCIAVLVAGSRQQLRELLTIKGLVADFRTLLILPDDDKETISNGHHLSPRYVGFADDNLSDFTAVLDKTLHVLQQKGNR